MRKAVRPFAALITAILIPALFAACGYRPLSRVYDVPGLKGAEPLPLYMPMWGNNTNEFGLETTVFNKVADWLQGSEYIQLTKSAAQADYLLTATIRAMDPTPSRGTVRLTVASSLQDKNSGKMLWPQAESIYTKSYLISNDALATDSERQKSQEEIADDIGEKIYVRFLNTIAQLRKTQAEKSSPTGSGAE